LSPEIAGEPDGAFACDDTATGAGPKIPADATPARRRVTSDAAIATCLVISV
jgi:hypothetical protein